MKGNYFYVAVVALAWMALTAGFNFLPRSRVSMLEKRDLQHFPAFTADSLADGSYTAKCSYFMRISFEGIGLHDLSRGSYGGNTYINNGSHGCINMRYSEVKQLYEMVERGTPCILYY